MNFTIPGNHGLQNLGRYKQAAVSGRQPNLRGLQTAMFNASCQVNDAVLPIVGTTLGIVSQQQQILRDALSNYSKINVFNLSDEGMGPRKSQDFNLDVRFLIVPLLRAKTQHLPLQQQEFVEVVFALRYRAPKNHAFYVAPLRGGQSC